MNGVLLSPLGRLVPMPVGCPGLGKAISKKTNWQRFSRGVESLSRDHRRIVVYLSVVYRIRCEECAQELPNLGQPHRSSFELLESP